MSKVSGPTGKIPAGGTLTRPASKVPVANKAASLIFFYYGDSPQTTVFQETLKLKKAMEGYAFKVLLKHDSTPPWLDLSEKDEKLANIKDAPTQANLFKYIIQLAEDGYFIDLFIFAHGWPNSFRASAGTNGSNDSVRDTEIMSELHPSKTGFTKMPIRIVWGTNCWGQTLNETWRSVGAKTTAGACYVNFYPNVFGNFIGDWNEGNISFNDAVAQSDTNAVRTAVQTYISTIEAPARKQAGDWDGCPFGKFVLGNDPCAKDYFESCWLNPGEGKQARVERTT